MTAKKLNKYDRIGSDGGCEGCIVKGDPEGQDAQCMIDGQKYCGFTKGRGHHLIPAPVCDAAVAVIEAADELPSWATCKCYDNEVCAVCKIRLALDKYREVTKDG